VRARASQLTLRSKKMARKQPRDEFRKYKKSGHPAYIFEKVGDEFRFLGITHSKIDKGTTNIELEKNPDPEDNGTAYIKTKSEQDKQNRFGEAKKKWKFHPNDKKKVAKIIKSNKKRSAPSKSRK